jgi:hypothetical protein
MNAVRDRNATAPANQTAAIAATYQAWSPNRCSTTAIAHGAVAAEESSPESASGTTKPSQRGLFLRERLRPFAEGQKRRRRGSDQAMSERRGHDAACRQRRNVGEPILNRRIPVESVRHPCERERRTDQGRRGSHLRSSLRPVRQQPGASQRDAGIEQQDRRSEVRLQFRPPQKADSVSDRKADQRQSSARGEVADSFLASPARQQGASRSGDDRCENGEDRGASPQEQEFDQPPRQRFVEPDVRTLQQGRSDEAGQRCARDRRNVQRGKPADDGESGQTDEAAETDRDEKIRVGPRDCRRRDCRDCAEESERHADNSQRSLTLGRTPPIESQSSRQNDDGGEEQRRRQPRERQANGDRLEDQESDRRRERERRDAEHEQRLVDDRRRHPGPAHGDDQLTDRRNEKGSQRQSHDRADRGGVGLKLFRPADDQLPRRRSH